MSKKFENVSAKNFSRNFSGMSLHDKLAWANMQAEVLKNCYLVYESYDECGNGEKAHRINIVRILDGRDFIDNRLSHAQSDFIYNSVNVIVHVIKENGGSLDIIDKSLIHSDRHGICCTADEIISKCGRMIRNDPTIESCHMSHMSDDDAFVLASRIRNEVPVDGKFLMPEMINDTTKSFICETASGSSVNIQEYVPKTLEEKTEWAKLNLNVLKNKFLVYQGLHRDKSSEMACYVTKIDNIVDIINVPSSEWNILVQNTKLIAIADKEKNPERKVVVYNNLKRENSVSSSIVDFDKSAMGMTICRKLECLGEGKVVYVRNLSAREIFEVVKEATSMMSDGDSAPRMKTNHKIVDVTNEPQAFPAVDPMHNTYQPVELNTRSNFLQNNASSFLSYADDQPFVPIVPTSRARKEIKHLDFSHGSV